MRTVSLPIVFVAMVLLAGHVAAQGAPPSRAEMRIAFDEFKKLYERGEVLVLDVRSAEAYRRGHIPGAVSVPLDDVEAKIPELKKETRAIVTYCTWAAEQTSAGAALTMRLAGVKNVRALLGGFDAWIKLGGEIETEAQR